MTRVRMGLVGGGPDAFIGVIHRMAAWLDGDIELVCGAFSRNPDKSKQAGDALHLPAGRCYENYQEMMRTEAGLPADERMEFVAIVTPNDSHYGIASSALEHGFHVLCEKPATIDLGQAKALQKQVKETGLLYGLTHTYTGYPMVQEARERVARGELGTVTKVIAEYTQGWLAAVMESDEGKQAAWRLDPQQAGASCCMGDIGVHAANLAETVTGLEIEKVLADLQSLEPGRLLDDDGSVLLRFENDVRGVLFASQICVGEENNLRLRVYGTLGGLDWQQQEPNSLWLKWPDRPAELLRAGQGYLGNTTLANTRTPPGHPEGYIEAFANLYRNFARAVRGSRDQVAALRQEVPGVKEAVRGMAFIEAVVASSNEGNRWVELPGLINDQAEE
jgi:predicted dehydrogenase